MMKSENWPQGRSMIVVLSIGAFLTGCETANQERLNQAARVTAEAEQTQETIKAVTKLPDQPADCRKKERSNVALDDRYDVALVKTDQALYRVNNRIQRCAEWYDDLKRSRDSGPR